MMALQKVNEWGFLNISLFGTGIISMIGERKVNLIWKRTTNELIVQNTEEKMSLSFPFHEFIDAILGVSIHGKPYQFSLAPSIIGPQVGSTKMGLWGQKQGHEVGLS